MPVLTPSKSRLVQLFHVVLSPKDGAAYQPRRIIESQQGTAMVVGSGEARNAFQIVSFCNWNLYNSGFSIQMCKSERCFTCPKLNVSITFLLSMA